MYDAALFRRFIMIKEKIIKRTALFVGGLLCGTAGLSILKSKDAKRLYAESAAAVLRAKEEIMTGVTSVRETAGDILAEAKDINEQRAEEEAAKVIEDEAEVPAAKKSAKEKKASK